MLNLSATSSAQRWLVPAFFAVIFILGLFIYKDYGISTDEVQSRNNGMITLKHLALKVAPDWVAADHRFDEYTVPLDKYYDRDYGVVFETPVSLLERLFHLDDSRDIFLLRHCCTFIVCFSGLIAMHLLGKRRFNDWRIGLLAALWLLLSPRLFAEFFYNDKDAVFMALFAVAMNTGSSLLVKPTFGRALRHSLACALAIDVRIMGVLLPLVTLALLGWRGVRGEVPWGRLVAVTALHVVTLAAIVTVLWPYLWPAPLTNFVTAFRNMSTFRWENSTLYRGTLTSTISLPWHYAITWLSVTTPLLYVAAAAVGMVLVGLRLLQQHWRLWQDEDGLQDVFFLGLFVGPLLAVVVMHSVLYDGWRQLYFIYPAFLMLALRGWVAAARWRPRWAWWPKLIYGVTSIGVLVTAVQMVRDHPLQNVYFNLLAGPNAGEQFEMDYWGLGYQQDLNYILENDSRFKVKVFALTPTPQPQLLLIQPAFQRDRIQFVDKPEDADYFITNYRWHPEPYSYPMEPFQLWADGRRVHSVFRMHP